MLIHIYLIHFLCIDLKHGQQWGQFLKHYKLKQTCSCLIKWSSCLKTTLSLNTSSIVFGTSFSLKWTCFTFINKYKLELKVAKYQIFVSVLVMLGRVMLNIRDVIFLFFNVNQHFPKSPWFTETKGILSVTAFAFSLHCNETENRHIFLHLTASGVTANLDVWFYLCEREFEKVREMFVSSACNLSCLVAAEKVASLLWVLMYNCTLQQPSQYIIHIKCNIRWTQCCKYLYIHFLATLHS